MATINQLLELRGKIDDLVFYTLNGKQVVRKKSGFSKELYRNNPKYAKVRENSSEFGHASKSGKMIRVALQPYILNCEDKYLYQRFAKVMTQIKDMDIVSERGKRKIYNGLKNDDALQLLKNFRFGNIESVENIAQRIEGFFTITIITNKGLNVDSVELITLHPNFDLYIAQQKTQLLTVKGKQNTFEFEKYFTDLEAPTLLYFLVLRKGENVAYAGFI